MKKLFSLICFFCVCLWDIQAQTQITVAGKILNSEVNKEGKRNLPFTDELVEVFSYASKSDAEESIKLMSDLANKGEVYHGLKEIDITEADPFTGYYELKAYTNGWILVKVGLAQDLRPVNNQLHLDFKIRGAVQLGQVVVSAQNEYPNEIQIIPVSSPRFGNVLPLNLMTTIGSHMGKRNGRFIYQPFVVDCETNKIETYGRPYLIQGKEFAHTQDRRMGFDMKRDTLQMYTDTTRFLTNDAFTLQYTDTVRLKHSDHNYAVYGSFSFMDYNNIYYSKTTMVNTCRNILLMDFIQMPYFKPVYPNFEYYKKVAERKERPVPGEIQVNFLVNEARPDMSDSLTVTQLNSLVSMLREISSGSVLKSLSIEGVASPDGNYGKNKELAQLRTDYLQHFISDKLSVTGYDRKSTSRVTSWEELADTVAVSDTVLAEKLRAVIQRFENHNQKSVAVKQSGLMESLKPYLAKMRKVTYTCVYIVNRPLTPHEIWTKYKKNPHDNFLPYEYWHLFQMERDSVALETLYKRGAQVAKVYENGRPWILPECLLAASYIQRDTFDISLLEPLIDKTSISKSNPRPKLNYIKRDLLGHEQLVNPESVVANYLIMCLKTKNYEAASVAAQILAQSPKSRYKDMIAYAKCMRGLFYKDRDMMDRVSKYSPVNKVILNLMMGTNRHNAYAREALEQISKDTALYWYLKAVLDDRADQGQAISFDLPMAVKDLVKCFELDPKFIDKALRDGSLKEMTVTDAVQEYEMVKAENNE